MPSGAHVWMTSKSSRRKHLASRDGRTLCGRQLADPSLDVGSRHACELCEDMQNGCWLGAAGKPFAQAGAELARAGTMARVELALRTVANELGSRDDEVVLEPIEPGEEATLWCIIQKPGSITDVIFIGNESLDVTVELWASSGPVRSASWSGLHHQRGVPLSWDVEPGQRVALTARNISSTPVLFRVSMGVIWT